MTGNIMEAILSKFNRKLSSTNRSILLLMDNAGCHPEYLEKKFSNIKICFLPANTTSKLQPLDLGIIKNFKVHYRRFLLRYVLSKIDQCKTASEVTSSLNILMAIRWVAQAWKDVKEETTRKCFRSAGILDSSMDVVSCDMGEDDPFVDVDSDTDLQGLIADIIPETERCNAQEYVNGDDDLSTCNDTKMKNGMKISFHNWDSRLKTVKRCKRVKQRPMFKLNPLKQRSLLSKMPQ